MRHRPIGLGVQGLADAFFRLRYPFESPEAKELNRRIFETIYFAALDASCELAEQLGPYESYEGCPVSKGILQPDMWGVDTEELSKVSGLDWAGLRARIKKYVLLLASNVLHEICMLNSVFLFYLGLAFVIASSWRPCPQHQLRRFWGTLSPLSHRLATFTLVVF